MPTPIRAVCFDLGKVLIDFDKGAMAEKMSEKSPFSSEEITRLIHDDPQTLEYECGRVSSEQFFSHLKERLQFSDTPEVLREIWSNIFTPVTENIAIVQELARHYPIFLISNCNDAHASYIEAHYEILGHFPTQIFSHKVNQVKPEPGIYQHALSKMGGIAAHEAIFIDDLEANVAGAAALGFHTIHLRPDTDLRAALRPYQLKGLEELDAEPEIQPLRRAAARVESTPTAGEAQQLRS